MPRKKSFRKTAMRPVRFTDDQLERIERAATQRAQERGELVTGSEIIREGAIRLADEILAAA
jgi:hypothetical protein